MSLVLVFALVEKLKKDFTRELLSKLAESPSNSEFERYFDEYVATDKFERKMMAPRWMEEQFTMAESAA
ncbi:hypothetical protein Bca4012_054801 [Brassica carinata]